jgi:hypothetical protein
LDCRQAAPPWTTTQSALRLVRPGTRYDAPSTDFMPWLRMSCRPPDSDASLDDWWLSARQASPNLCTKALPR